MSNYVWRLRILAKRLRALPEKAVKAYREGRDSVLDEQANARHEQTTGLSIKTNFVAEAALVETLQAMSVFTTWMPLTFKDVPSFHLGVALDNLTIEWVEREVPEHRMLHQNGERWVIRTEWLGTAWESRLFHALLHFANMAVRLPALPDSERDEFVRTDHDHAETRYWGSEIDLCARLRDETERDEED